MAAASVLLSLILVPFAPGSHLPAVCWMFVSYAGITTGLIGLTLGAVFRQWNDGELQLLVDTFDHVELPAAPPASLPLRRRQALRSDKCMHAADVLRDDPVPHSTFA